MFDDKEDNRDIHIWVDADACPRAVKEIIYRAAERVRVRTTFVANANLSLPHSEFLHFLKVAAGFDVADHEISKRMRDGDLVITADIPLAAEVIDKGGHALNPRGTFYSTENVKAALSIRNFMDGLRATGTRIGGPTTFGHTERTAFANQLDRFLTRHLAGRHAAMRKIP